MVVLSRLELCPLVLKQIFFSLIYPDLLSTDLDQISEKDFFFVYFRGQKGRLMCFIEYFSNRKYAGMIPVFHYRFNSRITNIIKQKVQYIPLCTI